MLCFVETRKLDAPVQETYPDPTTAEVPIIREDFDNLFSAIQTRETDKGVAIFERSGIYLVNGKNTALRESVSPTASRVEAGRGEADVFTEDLFSPANIPPESARAQAEENYRIHVEQVEVRRFKSVIGLLVGVATHQETPEVPFSAP